MNNQEIRSSKMGLCNTLKDRSVWIISVILFVIALLIFYLYTIEEAANIGNFVAGFASALAFLWLIAGFYQQSKELALQRKELSLQREALKLQTQELKDSNKYQSLEHIRNIIENAVNKLGGDPNKKINEILCSPPNNGAKDVFESTDVEAVLDASGKLIAHYSPIFNFISEYSSALKLYLDSKRIIYSSETTKPAIFVLQYIVYARNTTYLSRDIFSVENAATFLLMYERVFDSAILAFFIANEKKSNSIIKNEFIQEKYNKLLQDFQGDKNNIPAIAKEYFSK